MAFMLLQLVAGFGAALSPNVIVFIVLRFFIGAAFPAINGNSILICKCYIVVHDRLVDLSVMEICAPFEINHESKAKFKISIRLLLACKLVPFSPSPSLP